jgi:LuxR family transcriptional regulator, maltose regulon positive regulatory protein
MMTSATEQEGTHLRRHPTRLNEPILASKITIPELPGWVVSRPRIEKQIVEGVQGPLTVVTGPPGAGKTMALVSWAASGGAEPIAWLTLDEYDNRPRVFWSYVVAALRRAGAAVPGAASALAHGDATGHAFLLRLAAVLAGQDPPVVLVLDDLHLVTDPLTLGDLAYVLRNARSGLHVLAASRTDPLLPLHQYRLTGELTEIRASDLAFSVGEAAMLMEQHGVTLPAAALESVHRRNEGWPAGLRMAAITLGAHPDPGRFVQDLVSDDAPVTSYLVEEVLNVQPPGVRDLLLRTSILDTVNADIAADLTGDDGAASSLSELARKTGFVQPAGQGSYRYHALFRDVLRLKLRCGQPGSVADLHRRAAGWYRRHEDLPAAVRHAGQAGDRQLTARIVVDELAIGHLMEPGGLELPAGVLQCAPEDAAQPQMLLASAAAALADARDHAARASLSAAEQLLEKLPDDHEVPSRLTTAMISLALARRAGDFTAAAAAVAAAEKLLEDLAVGTHAEYWDASARMLSGRGAVEFWSGDFDRAASLLHKAASLSGTEDTGAPCGSYEAASCRGYLALLHALRGRLSQAADLAAAATVVPHDSRAAQPCAPAAVALAHVHLERNELARARALLKLADASLRAYPDKLVSTVACLVVARARLADGHQSAAADMLARARSGWLVPPWLEHLLTVTESRVCAAAGEAPAAMEAARRADPERALDAAVALAHACLAAADLEAAKDALGMTAAHAGDTAKRVQVEAWLTDAHLSFRCGDPARGRRSLERALRLAGPEHLRLPFATERRWLRPALERHTDLAYTHKDVLGPRLVPDGMVSIPRTPDSQPPPLIEPLTERQRDVVRLAGELLSTEEIADKLFISVNTVKTHLRTSFRKLGVGDRRDAVRRAREAGLL